MDEGFRPGHNERAERRQRYRLRAVFDSAFEMVEIFFDPASGWGGLPLQHVIFRVVRENFPELTSEQVHSMSEALLRAYHDKTPHDGSLEACDPVRCPNLPLSS
ncbi:MAG: hypothetical protein WCK63_05300 [Betaproteobacteria bacterium]